MIAPRRQQKKYIASRNEPLGDGWKGPQTICVHKMTTFFFPMPLPLWLNNNVAHVPPLLPLPTEQEVVGALAMMFVVDAFYPHLHHGLFRVLFLGFPSLTEHWMGGVWWPRCHRHYCGLLFSGWEQLMLAVAAPSAPQPPSGLICRCYILLIFTQSLSFREHCK